MTIVFQGHVQSVHSTAAGIDVDVVPERSAVAEAMLTLHIPKHDAANWPVGAQVNFTVYCVAPKHPSGKAI